MLRDIWSTADTTSPRGKLQKAEFFFACKLVAVCQQGGPITPQASTTPTPLPKLGWDADAAIATSVEPAYPSFPAAAIDFQDDGWDEIGCDAVCALEAAYVDDLRSCLQCAEASNIPRSYPFPDEGNVQLIDLVLKKMGELAPNTSRSGGGSGGHLIG